ncbi:MAG: hemerythrin domain-containing protein [Kofleriaceae bacterium]
MTNQPDLFTNVHKGIRSALFETCIALGRAPDDEVPAAIRAQLRDVLHFIRHHGENEDVLLLPMLATSAPAAHARMREAHAAIEALMRTLDRHVDRGSATELYHRTCELTARYLDHLNEEELELEPQIRAALSADQLEQVGRGSLARTSPADARVMLAWMLPAMQPADASALMARLPAELQRELRPLIAVAGSGVRS